MSLARRFRSVKLAPRRRCFETQQERVTWSRGWRDCHRFQPQVPLQRTLMPRAFCLFSPKRQHHFFMVRTRRDKRLNCCYVSHWTCNRLLCSSKGG